MVRRRPGTVAGASCWRGAWAGLALASTSAALADDTVLEQVVVTGSRIPRPGLDSASPIVTLPESAFGQTADLSVERILNTLPQVVPASTAFSNEPSTDGMATVSLRGLGVAQTLVLVDGKRLMTADGRGTVDLNLLPPSLITGVEVVSGGASAAYGSDAVAGVVNFHLRDDYDGVMVSGRYADAWSGDASDYTIDITAGSPFADGRGSVVAYAASARRGQLNQSARDVSRVPLAYYATPGGGGEFVGEGGLAPEGVAVVFPSAQAFEDLFATYGYPPGSVPPQAGFGTNPDGTLFTIGTREPGTVVNYRGPVDPDLPNDRFHSWNGAPTTALRMPLERTTLFGRAAYELTDAHRAYAQLIYSTYEVDRQLSPVEAQILLVPPTNPYLPPDMKMLLDSRSSPSAPFRFLRRITETGPRRSSNDRTLFQATGGITGRLSGDWGYDAYVQWGQNDRTERQSGNVSIGRFQELAFAPDGGYSICGEFNPFLVGHISPACAEYIALDGSNRSTLQQLIAEATLHGTLGSLPAGPIRTAIGTFYRGDRYDFDPDAATSAMLPAVPGVIGPRPDITGFASSPARSGEQSNVDLYGELLFPLLRDLPGALSLDLDLGARWASYRHGGTADAYKAEATYRPVRPVMLRSSYQHAVRAPSIDELFYPQMSNQFVIGTADVNDPCDVRSAARNGPDRAQVEALCLAQGMPEAKLADYRFPLKRVDGVSGGNPDLESEQADTLTVGIVLEPPSLSGLRMSLDWYSIDLDDAIGRWDAMSAVARCFDPAYNPGYDVGNIYCSFFTRVATTGDIRALIVDRNIGRIETEGVDLQVDYSHALGEGSFTGSLYVTRVNHWNYSDPSGGETDYVGTIGSGGLDRALPKWKSLLSLGYSWHALSLVGRWNYIDGMRDATYPSFEVPARNYLDLGGSWAFESGPLDGLSLQAGIDNLTDTDPPVFPSYSQANTDPSVYDVLGRRYYLGASYRFQ